MTNEQREKLRHQMYAWCISNGLANDKEEAKTVLKQNGFLIQKPVVLQKTKEVIKEVKTVPSKKELRSMIRSWKVEEKLSVMSNLVEDFRHFVADV